MPAKAQKPEMPKGLAGARQAAGGGSGLPRVRLKGGERARFHIISTGADDLIFAARFHWWGEFPNSKEAICLEKLTGGEVECEHCNEGHTDVRRRFALWVYVHNVLRINDNPEEEGDGWAIKKVKTEDGRTRNLFQQEVKKILLLELAMGRGDVTFNQFTSEFTAKGSLQNWVYELLRIGEGIDTQYILRAARESAIPEKILKSEEVSKLMAIPDYYRNSGSSYVAPKGVMGDDDLDGGEEPEELPKGEKTSEEPDVPADNDKDGLI